MTEPRDRGSIVLMVPAAVLIVLMLAGLAVDTAVEFLSRHQLDDAAAAAANDAVTQGLDRARFDRDSSYTLDPVLTDAAVRRSLAARHDPIVDDALATGGVAVSISTTADPARPAIVTVTITGHAHLIFTKAVPGLPSTVTVRSRESATVVLAA